MIRFAHQKNSEYRFWIIELLILKSFFYNLASTSDRREIV